MKVLARRGCEALPQELIPLTHRKTPKFRGKAAQGLRRGQTLNLHQDKHIANTHNIGDMGPDLPLSL